MVADSSSAAPQEHGQPTNDVWVEVHGQQAIEEEGVTHTVEGFREIGSGDYSAAWRLTLVKAIRDHGGEREKGSYGGVAGAETVLKRGFRERGKEERTEETLKNFGGRAKERDGAVGGTKVRGFTWFGYGKNKGVFPACLLFISTSVTLHVLRQRHRLPVLADFEYGYVSLSPVELINISDIDLCDEE